MKMSRWLDYFCFCMTCRLEEEAVDKTDMAYSREKEVPVNISNSQIQQHFPQSTSHALLQDKASILPSSNSLSRVTNHVAAKNAVYTNINDQFESHNKCADPSRSDAVSECGQAHGYINLSNSIHNDSSKISCQLNGDEAANLQCDESKTLASAALQHIDCQAIAKEDTTNSSEYLNLWNESSTVCLPISNSPILSSCHISTDQLKTICTNPVNPPRKCLERENRPPPLQLFSNDTITLSGRRQASLDMPLPTRIFRSQQSSTSSEESKGEDMIDGFSPIDVSTHSSRSRPAQNAPELNYLELSLPISGGLIRHASSSDASPATFSTLEDTVHHDMFANHEYNHAGVKAVEYREIDTVRTAALHSVARERR